MSSTPRDKIFLPRLYSLYLLAIGIFIFLALGLFWRQGIQSFTYQEKERLQNQRRLIIPAARGNIYDRNGELLVGNRPVFNAMIDLVPLRRSIRKEYIRLREPILQSYQELSPTEQDATSIDYAKIGRDARRNVVQKYLDQINAILSTNHQVNTRSLQRHFYQDRLLPYPLLKDLSPTDYSRLIEQISPDSPIQILTDSDRYYPYNNSAAHILGYVGTADKFKEDHLPGENLRTKTLKGKRGRAGIELQFNDHLQGESGAQILRVDPSGFQYDLIETIAPQQGKSLELSIDLRLQITAEQAMQEKIGAIAALDIRTGEVLCLVSKPDYDLNNLNPAENAWLNRAIQGLYPPGSTFKPITAIAGLKKGVFDPQAEIFCEGYYRVGNRLFPDHNRSGFGNLTLDKALAVSSNVYFYQVGLATTAEEISKEAKLFRLDQKTGIELPYETSRMLVPDAQWKKKKVQESWFPGDTANLSIGQGFLSNTPLQMACFVAALARGHTQTTPTILKNPQRTLPISPIALRRSDLDAVYQGMRKVVALGSGRRAQVPNWEVAGKTGSAQTRYRGEELTMAWFIGYAPFQNPQIAIAVLVEPKDSSDDYHGGTTAAPIAQPIFAKYKELYID